MNDKQDQKEFWQNFWDKQNIELELNKSTSQWIFGDKIKFEYFSKYIPQNFRTSLEVGCGSATISLLLAKNGFQTTLVDFSESALIVAKKRFEKVGLNATFIKCDAESLLFPDNSFDIVLSCGLLEHFENPEKAISEMVRVLKPGGIFLSDIITKRFSVLMLGKIISFLIRFLYHSIIKFNFSKALWDYKDIFNPGFYENSYSSNEYKKFMEKSGLLNVKIVGFMPFPPLYVPEWIEKIYVRILKKIIWINRFFTNSSKISLFWCYAWILYGIKKCEYKD